MKLHLGCAGGVAAGLGWCDYAGARLAPPATRHVLSLDIDALPIWSGAVLPLGAAQIRGAKSCDDILFWAAHRGVSHCRSCTSAHQHAVPAGASDAPEPAPAPAPAPSLASSAFGAPSPAGLAAASGELGESPSGLASGVEPSSLLTLTAGRASSCVSAEVGWPSTTSGALPVSAMASAGTRGATRTQLPWRNLSRC